ncbi:hypothetical protein IJ732_03970, partial [bacterium]|nr:hypothetical protein [bacterium]
NCTAYDNGQCSQCENGYQNNGTSCRDIRENTCDTYSGTTCTKCTTENLLVDNECISKSSLHCQTSDGVSCTECNSDYHDENGTCAKGYVENCSVYDGEKCQKCNNSLVPNGYTNQCVEGMVLSDGTNAVKLGDKYVYFPDKYTKTNYSSLTESCDTKDMRIATRAELQTLAQNYSSEIPSGWYYSSSDVDGFVGTYKWQVYFASECYYDTWGGANTYRCPGSYETATFSDESADGAICVNK